MSLYSEIESFKQLFHGVRIHEDFIIIDLKLPINWEEKKILHQATTTNEGNTVQMKVNSSDKNSKLISFYSIFDEKNTNILLNEIKRVIKWNTDVEEKNQLLNKKMIELQKVFHENNLDSLRDVNINFYPNPKSNTHEGEENNQLVQSGNPEG
tara:strand:+ start:3429 stop:3887 length:459 start_codon:yes stop_codon:yes gene_type:complete